MTVRAKFKVDSIEVKFDSVKDAEGKWVQGKVSTIWMSPVYGNDDPNHENTKFWSATPSGSLNFNCVNSDAVSQFDLGREFYVDFTPAPVADDTAA